jgi:hypothetical protein
MRKVIILIVLLLTCGNMFSQDRQAILDAMRDEIKRSINDLNINSLQKPYYIEYKLVYRDAFTVSSTLGSVVDKGNNKSATLNVAVRVGNYKFDNSNFFDFSSAFFGSGDEEERFKGRPIPIELDYNSLRRELWLATDAAYKQVTETYTKKETSLKNRIRKDTTHDFLKVQPFKNYFDTEYPKIDENYFVKLTSDLSGVFLNYPEIDISTAGIEYLPEVIYYVNSEGMEYVKCDYYIGLEVVGATQAKDGMPISNYYTAFSKEPAKLPSADSLKRAVTNLANKIRQTIDAGTLDEPYSGPVLFEGEAATSMLAQVFVPNLAAQRDQISEGGFADNNKFGAFQNKIGGRVLPDFVTVKSQPSMKTFGNTVLFGSFFLDDDGLKPEDLVLVDKGYLRNLLSSRVPTKRVRESNGNQRGGAPMFGVIQIEAEKKYKKTNADLKKQLIKLIKDRELPYGIIVRKAMDQNILFTTMFRITAGTFSNFGEQSTIPVVEAYKLFPDGKEELIRGTEASGFTAQSFKDIIFLGNTQYAMNYLAPSVTSPFVTGGSQYLGATIISGDLLFEDGEIKPLDQDFPKPPIISPPVTNKCCRKAAFF